MKRSITRALSLFLAVGALAACSAAPTESVTTGESAVTATPMDTPVSAGSVSCSVAQTCSYSTGQLAVTCSLNPGEAALTVELKNGGGQVVASGKLAPGYAPVTLDDTYALTSAPQTLSYWIVPLVGETNFGTSFSITALPLSDCEPVIVGAGGGCSPGSTWDEAENKCITGCNTPACQCRASGGAWDGKRCE